MRKREKNAATTAMRLNRTSFVRCSDSAGSTFPQSLSDSLAIAAQSLSAISEFTVIGWAGSANNNS